MLPRYGLQNAALPWADSGAQSLSLLDPCKKREENSTYVQFCILEFLQLTLKEKYSPSVLFGKKLLCKRDNIENCQCLNYSKRILPENDCNPLLMIRSLNSFPAGTEGCPTLRTAKLFVDSGHLEPKVEKNIGKTCIPITAAKKQTAPSAPVYRNVTWPSHWQQGDTSSPEITCMLQQLSQIFPDSGR